MTIPITFDENSDFSKNFFEFLKQNEGNFEIPRNKKLLFIRISDDISDITEGAIYCKSALHKIEFESIKFTSAIELEKHLDGKQYDYIYFAGHGNIYCLGESNICKLYWEQIAEIICNKKCLYENAIIMLYCCKGGLNDIAYKLFANCDSIEYVCGVKQNVLSIDLLVGFNVFLYNIGHRAIDPILSAQRATLATEVRFECFSRSEAESNLTYLYEYKNKYNHNNTDVENCSECYNNDTHTQDISNNPMENANSNLM